MLAAVTRGLLNKSVIGAAALAMIGIGSAAQADVELTFYYPVAVGGPVTKVVDGYAETYSEMTPGVTVHACLYRQLSRHGDQDHHCREGR